MTTSVQPSRTAQNTVPSPWPPALAGAAAAGLGWLALVPVGGAHLTVDTGSGPTSVRLVSAVLAGLVGGLGALGVGRAARRLARPRAGFVLAALVLLAGSLVVGPPAATDVGSGLGLAGLHVLVGAVVIPLAARRLPGQRTTDGGHRS